MLNEEKTINQLQSSTVKAALIAIVINVLALVTAFTGVAFDIEMIKTVMEFGITAIVNAASIYLGWKAIKGRIFAENKVEPLPWLEAAKTLKKGNEQ